MADVTKLKVYVGGTPNHAQTRVDPQCRVVDYLDDEDNTIATVVHDAADIDDLVHSLGADLVTEKLGEPSKPQTQVMAEREAETVSPEADEVPLESRTVAELADIAATLDISGRSSMNKSELIAAIQAEEG